MVTESRAITFNLHGVQVLKQTRKLIRFLHLPPFPACLFRLVICGIDAMTGETSPRISFFDVCHTCT